MTEPRPRPDRRRTVAGLLTGAALGAVLVVGTVVVLGDEAPWRTSATGTTPAPATGEAGGGATDGSAPAGTDGSTDDSTGESTDDSTGESTDDSTGESTDDSTDDATAGVTADSPTNPDPATFRPLTDVDCAAIEARAVALSAEQATDGRTLTAVTGSTATTDHRADYAVPAADGRSVVLVCSGTGVWSDGATSALTTTLSIDASGALFVGYR